MVGGFLQGTRMYFSVRKGLGRRQWWLMWYIAKCLAGRLFLLPLPPVVFGPISYASLLHGPTSEALCWVSLLLGLILDRENKPCFLDSLQTGVWLGGDGVCLCLCGRIGQLSSQSLRFLSLSPWICLPDVSHSSHIGFHYHLENWLEVEMNIAIISFTFAYISVIFS